MHQPDMLALEQLFSHYERPRTAILMGHARGVICLAAGQAGIEVAHFEPTRIKKVMTGNGRAPKHQIQLAVKLQLGLPSIPEPADVADALLTCEIGHRRRRIHGCVESDQHHFETVVAEGGLGLFDHFRQVPRGHRANLVATGVNHAQYHRLAAQLLEAESPPAGIGEAIPADRVAERALAEFERAIVVEIGFGGVQGRPRRDVQDQPADQEQEAHGDMLAPSRAG